MQRLDLEGRFGELAQHGRGQGGPFAFLRRHLRKPRALLAVGDDLPFLGADVGSLRRQGAAIDDVGVRRDLAAHHRLAEAEAGVDDHLAALASGGIGREQDAGHFRRHHRLHHHRHAHRAMVHAVAMPVADGLRRPQRRPALPRRRNHGIRAGDVEERLLLSGEGEIRQILRGGGGAHRHRRRVRQAAVGGRYRARDVVRHGMRTEQRLNVCGGLLEGHRALLERRPRQRQDARLQRVIGHEPTVRGGGDLESSGHVEAGPGQTRQGAPLAANDFEPVLRRVEGQDEGPGAGRGRRGH